MSIFFAAPIDEFPDYDKVTTIPTNAESAAGFPASNLLTMDPTQVNKNSDQSMTLNWDFGSQKTFDVVALVHCNFLESTTWTVSGSNDGSAYTTLRSSTGALAHWVSGQTVQNKRNMLPKNMALWVSPTVQTWRYLRVVVSDPDVNYRPSVGRLFVGTKFVPTTGWQYGSAQDFNDLSRKERTDRGALVTDPQDPIRIANVKMEFLTKAEMIGFIHEFNFWRGAAREILACLDVEDIPNLQKNLYYCTISEGRRTSYDSYNTHSVNWILESIA